MASTMCDTWTYGLDDDMEIERLDMPEIDAALLSELLEEGYLEDAEDESLQRVIESLQAEIGTTNSQAMDGDVVVLEAIGMDDILSDLESCGSSTYQVEEDQLLDWVDMEGNWSMNICMDEGAMVGYYSSFCYNEEHCGEQMCNSLWE